MMNEPQHRWLYQLFNDHRPSISAHLNRLIDAATDARLAFDAARAKVVAGHDDPLERVFLMVEQNVAATRLNEYSDLLADLREHGAEIPFDPTQTQGEAA